MSRRVLLDECSSDVDIVLQDALDIALDYLEVTSQASPSEAIQEQCCRVIIDEWTTGRKHRIWLANKAIVAVTGATNYSK